jgi:hypothetical protein
MGQPASVAYPSARVTAISSTAVTPRNRNLVRASAPCLLAVCSDVAVPPVILRHWPASESAESRMNRHSLTLKNPIRHQGCGLLIRSFVCAGVHGTLQVSALIISCCSSGAVLEIAFILGLRL